MSIYNEYLEGQERVEAIQNAKLDNEIARYTTLLEMTMLQSEQMERDAELKVFEESGTYDDLAYLLEEAEAETKQKSQGLLSKIMDGILSILRAIRDSIKNLFGKKEDPEAEVEVPESTVNDGNLITKAINDLKTGASKLVSGDISGAADIAKVVLPTLGIAAGAAGAVKLIKMKVSQRNQITNEQDKNASMIEGWITKIKSMLGKFSDFAPVKSALGVFQKFAGAIRDFVGKISGATSNTKVAKAVNAAKDGVEAREYVFTKRGFTYKIHPDGKYDVSDDRGASVTRTLEQLPGNVAKIVSALSGGAKPAQPAQGAHPAENGEAPAQESMTLDDARELLGSDYMVEMAEDGSFVIREMDMITLEAEAAKSIFGMDPEDMEEVTESTDEELDDFMLAFEEL